MKKVVYNWRINWMKKFSILLIIMPLFILSSCTVIYPSLPNAYIEDIPSDGVEVYCYKDKNNWFCLFYLTKIWNIGRI